MSLQIVKQIDPIAIIIGGLVPKGAYNGGTTYAIGDSVSYNGSSYVCISASTGNLPTNTTYWQVLASKGDTGATGSTGATGATGAAGANGRVLNVVAGSNISVDSTDVANPVVSATGLQPLDATLTSLAAFNTNGLLTQTAADTFAARTITGTANQVTVTNGDGVSGNPTLSLPQNIHTGASPTFAGLTVNTDNLFVDSANNRIGVLTTAPTHTVTLSSTATGIALYNTTDQTTNYERGVLSWSSNELILATSKGGTGTARQLTLYAGVTSLTVRPSESSGGSYELGRSLGNAGTVHTRIFGTLSASSGLQYGLSLPFTISQSSTAGYTVILANVTETTTGSGAKNFLDFQIGGTSRFSIDNNGNITTMASLTMRDAKDFTFGTTTGTKIGTATTQKLAFWNTTPIVQPSGSIVTALSNLGLVASPTIGASDGVQTFTNKARRSFYMFEDFLNTTQNSVMTTVTQNSGSIAASNTDAATTVGMTTASTNALSNGGAGHWSNSVSGIFFGSTAVWTQEMRVQIPTLSDGTNTFQVLCGFRDNTFSESADGVYFSYTHSENAGNWTTVTSKASSRTRTDSGVAVVGGSWVVLKIVVLDVSGTLTARFYINDSQVGGDITTNIPNTTSNLFGYGSTITKSVGTTNRTLLNDYMEISGVFTSNR